MRLSTLIFRPVGSILIALFLFSSCKNTQKVISTAAVPKLNARKIVEAHYATSSTFNTLSGKVKIEYTNGGSKQGFNVSLRMKKDEIIWMSATLGVVKAKITPEKVSFYNRLQNEYFEGDFRYLSDLLGTDLDFLKVQNMLLGNSAIDLREGRYTSEVVNGTYQLQPRSVNAFFNFIFNIDPKNFRVAGQAISQPTENRFMQMSYTYQNISGRVLPKEITINVDNQGDKAQLLLEYKNMEFDRTVGYPYKIPKGFSKIEL